MKWRNRTVSDNLNVNKITINNLFKMYREEKLSVNRRYQRKLVWTLQEKKDFIDTLLRKYPIPLILFASYKYKDTEEECTEIIDGLQRLESIFSFISGKYPIRYDKYTGYFNLDALPGYGSRIRNDELEQSMPPLSLELCEQFLDYEVPCSTTEKSNADIDEIFRRINARGRVLANQDLRQAGVTGLFADIVRKTSSYIRGDYTDKDILKVNEITEYSLNNKNLNYGVKIDEVFWLEQDIINETQLRKSKDEEIIAHLYVYLLTKGEYSSSTRMLEKAYKEGDLLKSRLDNELINNYDFWIEFFAKNISIFYKTFSNKNFRNTLFNKSKVYNKDLAFIILFLAVSNLRQTGMMLKNKDLFLNLLNNLGQNELDCITNSAEVTWNKEIRDRLIERVQNILIKCFDYEKIQKREDADFDEWEVRMINLLEDADSEEQMYDFKAAITDFNTGCFNNKVISKIVKTLTAMVNTKPYEEGIIIIGIPDTSESSDLISKHLQTNIVHCKTYDIIGIKDEALKYYDSVDNYRRVIKEAIEKEKITDKFKNEILTRIERIKYKGKLLLCFRCKSDVPVFYNSKLFVRYDSHNHEVELGSDEFNIVQKRFYEYAKDT